MLKRTCDLVIAGLLLILLSPVVLMASIAICLTMGLPVLFRQTRPGRNGKLFTLYKLRTMMDPTSERSTDAQRLTRLGKWLRATSIDELPELYNVLKGEMSLVGPRPLLVEYLPLYSATQARRLEVRPGITGWAQVNGRNSISWENRLALDVWYVDNQSLLLDLRILFQTLITVVRREGISQKGHATMDRFRGSEK
ncbi:MAG: sugar transferase [Gammaproteobacteria bacterium]